MIANGFNLIVCDGRVLNLFTSISCHASEKRMVFTGLWALCYTFYYIRKYTEFYISKLTGEFHRWENKKRIVTKCNFRMTTINSPETGVWKYFVFQGYFTCVGSSWECKETLKQHRYPAAECAWMYSHNHYQYPFTSWDLALFLLCFYTVSIDNIFLIFS